MSVTDLDCVIESFELAAAELQSLQSRKVRDILLIASLFDSHTLSEGQQLSELIIGAYEALELSGPPTISRVSSPQRALELLATKRYDLVITMAQAGDIAADRFGLEAKALRPDLNVYLVAHNMQELRALHDGPSGVAGIDRCFVWRGDARLFLAMIKLAEDLLNVENDARVGGVRSIILVEDSVPFYSAYLPVLLTELVKQTAALISQEVNLAQRLLRRRMRPKLLLANSYEEACRLYDELQDTVLCVISDLHFPRGGVEDPDAGILLLEHIRARDPTLPLIVQSSDDRAAAEAEKLHAGYLDKRSPTLLIDFRSFMMANLGFGDFVFRLPDGTAVARASDVDEMVRMLETIPAEGLVFHGSRNHFSNWLMARTEYRLASALRQVRVSDFENVEDMRSFLTQTMASIQAQRRRGQVEDFDAERFDEESRFVRIGAGSLGGKARGLAFVHQLLGKLDLSPFISDRIHLLVPRSVVIATDVFDRFLESNGLLDFAMHQTDDEAVLARFQAADLPPDVDDALGALLAKVRYPLAVRSSSLLEDSAYLPAAGVYPTHMLPNVAADLGQRRDELASAIKHIYAATFFQAAMSYADTGPRRLEEEKMAVVIQEVIGRPHEQYVYPDLSGVATSHNFYPIRDMRPDEGIASVAMGLGRTVVEGGRTVRFSPYHPQWVPELSLPADALESAQREFWALDVSARPDFSIVEAGSNLALLDLAAAERHGTLGPVASVYSPDNDAVYDGIGRPGIRLVTFSPILKHNAFPLAETLQRLLRLGTLSLAGPVEIEFAANVRPASEGPSDFALLQIRPLVLRAAVSEADWRGIRRRDVFVRAGRALGIGHTTEIRDIVAVRSDTFDRSRTVDIASDVRQVNAVLRASSTSYVLIGPGRWGSADRWLGIPVKWPDIAAARLIVERQLEDIAVEPSQGSHFFHNITSLGIGYFTVGGRHGGCVDEDWLQRQPLVAETAWIRHYRCDRPLEVMIDGQSGEGVILKRLRRRHT